MSDPLRRDLSIIARSHMNSKCADCRAKAPTFASYTLGIFLCAACAQAHRDLLPQRSHTRSLMYDAWSADSVRAMSDMGNLKFNAAWEALLPMSQRVGAGVSEEHRRAFIQRKYIDKEWFAAPPAPGEPAATPEPPGMWVSPPGVLPMSRAERRRVKMNKVAAQCELEAAEDELRRLNPALRAEPAFSDAGARAAAEALAASAVLPQRLPPLHPLLSFVLTTSAVPSNPSLELVKRVLQSLELYLGLDQHRPEGFDEQDAEPAAAAATETAGETSAPTEPASSVAASSLPTSSVDSSSPPTDLTSASSSSPQPRRRLKCQLLLVMDGYALDTKLRAGSTPKFKNGMLDAASIDNYEMYKTRLREMIASQPYEHLHLIGLELPFRQGFAGAVHQALHFVSTPYIMLCQHDWAFIKRLPHSVWQLLECMERNKPKPEEAAAQARQNEEEQDLMEAAAAAEEAGDTTSDASASPQPDASAVPASSPSPSPPVTAASLPAPSLSPSASASSSASPAPASPAILPLNYIGFMASTTTSYLAKDFHDVARHVGKAVHRLHVYPVDAKESAEQYAHLSKQEAQKISMECNEHSPIPLCPVYFWFDRNHLVRTSYYRDLVFGSYRFMRSAAFIEDTFGQLQLNMLRDSYRGAKQHRRHPFSHYASFLYYPDNGLVSYVDHAHGRKYMTDSQRSHKYGARDQQDQEKIARRAEEAKARAAEAAQGVSAEREEEFAIDGIWCE